MNNIKIRCIRNKPVKIFNPDGTLLCETDNELQFNDIRIQIKDQESEGYYLEFEGEISNIDSDNRSTQLFILNITTTQQNKKMI